MSKTIPIKIHWSLYLLFCVSFIENFLKEDIYQALIKSIILLLVIGSIVLHEYGHIIVASLYGIKTKEIILHLFGAFAIMEPFSHLKHHKVILFCLAGPAVNFILAGIFCLFVGGIPNNHEGINIFFYLNLVLGIFNLFPIYPLDGGRIIRSSCLILYSERTGLLLSLSVSIVWIIGLLIIAVFSGNILWLMLISILAFVNAIQFLDLINKTN